MLGLSIPITFDNFSETYKTRKDIREWNEAKINAYLIQSSIHDYLARNESLAELPVGKLNNHILLKKLNLSADVFNTIHFTIKDYYIVSINKSGSSLIVVNSFDGYPKGGYFLNEVLGWLKLNDDLTSLVIMQLFNNKKELL